MARARSDPRRADLGGGVHARRSSAPSRPRRWPTASAGDEGPVTQFELLTAAAFVAFAAARVEYAVIEAGLGGRLDATNVIPSQLTVLTSVGYDHTEWLGETLEEIAAEKVAVLRDHTALIADSLPAEVWPVVEREVGRRHAEASMVDVEVDPDRPDIPGPQPSAGGGRSQSRAGTEARSGGGPALDALIIPGRAQFVPGDPPEIFDAAHNPDGAQSAR